MAKAQIVTKLERRVLLRAANEAQGVLLCPEVYDVRIWMTHLAKLAHKGYIDRRGRFSFISDLGRAVLQ